MQSATYEQVSKKTGAIKVTGGESLANRALAAHIVGDRDGQEYRLCLETRLTNGGEVWGIYKGASTTPEYAVEVEPASVDSMGAKVIRHCNCPDCQCRKKTCKHEITLAVRVGYAVRLRCGAIVGPASRLLTRPLSQMEMVAVFAAEIETQEKASAAPREGGPCPLCGGKLIRDYDGFGPHLSCDNGGAFGCYYSLSLRGN